MILPNALTHNDHCPVAASSAAFQIMSPRVYSCIDMEQILNQIRVSLPDSEVNGVLAAIPDAATGVRRAVRFNQSEELFLELESAVSMPRFPIHHDIRQCDPRPEYSESILLLTERLCSLAPDIFRGLTYFFDPTEPLKPRFYRIYKIEESLYLFLFGLDLVFRHFQGDIEEPGTNDMTPSYSTRRLFIESEIVPLDSIEWDQGKARAFHVRQLVSNTWIGETGRGYLQHGIWMDNDLSKFFTKLISPEGARIYPYFPLFCKYKTMCAQPAPPSPEFRKRLMPLLHRAIAALSPEMNRIQSALKGHRFSEDLPDFIELRKRIPQTWKDVISGIYIKSYLNDKEAKEYALEHRA